MGGFEFIDVIRSLKLHKKHGEICLLSASINPLDKEKAKQKNIRFIDKPLKINNLLQKI
jgi:CheY-like chemotaxis protein